MGSSNERDESIKTISNISNKERNNSIELNTTLNSTVVSLPLHHTKNKKNNINLNDEKIELNQPEIRKYTFVEELGRGGFGKVKLYKEKENPNKLVAVKEYLGISESNFPKEYKKEKKLLSEINHKYIVKYIFSCFDNDNFYIGMEYCEKRDLNKLINNAKKKNEKIEEKFIWKVAYQTLKALEYLHIEKKVVHNDVKPLNLLLTKDNDIKLTDFGISGIIPILSNISTTMKITDNEGTLIFSTPPEFLKDKQTTFKTDIWSLGCSLYTLANLTPPFSGKNRAQLEMDILQNEPRRLDKKYSNELDDFIFKMLNKDPIKRYSSTECLNIIPPQYKQLDDNKNNNRNFYDFSPLFFGIDIPKIPLDIKKTFCDYYFLIYEFPKFTLRDFLCFECEKENKSAFPFIEVDFIKEEVNCYCQNEHYYSGTMIDFYKIFTSSKSYRNEINELYCSDCRLENVFYPKENFKYCELCKKVLCPKCEKNHTEINQNHNIKNRYINPIISCSKHDQNYEYFCKDCLINYCSICSIKHQEQNPYHDIIEIKNQIDEDVINKINMNIEDVKKSIIFSENLIKTKQSSINKFYFLNSVNKIKLLLLYKLTFLNMYQRYKNNYIIIKNLLDNDMTIPKLEILMELDENNEKLDKIFEVLTPFYFNDNDISISRYREIINLPLHKNKINSVILYSNFLITFSEDKSIKIIDKNNFNIIKEIYGEFDSPIYEAIKLLNQEIIVGYGDKIKIISFDENEKKIYTKQTINILPQENVSSILELNSGFILVLCNGKLFSIKKIDGKYKIFKKNINSKEIIYSMIELDENLFLIICKLNKYNNNSNSCHFQIYNSKDILLNYNSTIHFYFDQNKNNVIKFNNEYIFFISDYQSNNDMYYISEFNFKKKIFHNFRVPMKLNKIYKIFETCFLGIANFNGKYILSQYMISSINDNYCIVWKYGFITTKVEIENIFIFKDMIILLDIDGKIIIYQIENQCLNMKELSLESKIKERNEKLKNKKIENNEIKNENIGDKFDDLNIIESKFKIIETEKYGNCLFDALGKAENILAQDMRNILTDYLEVNFKKLEGFEQEMELNGENIDIYIKKMKNPTEYGTHIEIYAYSLFYKKKVIIYVIDENGNGKGLIKNIGEENKETTYLLFISHNNNNSNAGHYKLLIKK